MVFYLMSYISSLDSSIECRCLLLVPDVEMGQAGSFDGRPERQQPVNHMTRSAENLAN